MTTDRGKARAPKAAGGQGGFYRLMRDLHGYASAVAFTLLLFFAVTGVLLNHPGLLQGKPAPNAESVVKLDKGQVAALVAAKDPPRALADLIAAKTRLKGVYQTGEADGPRLFVRLQGVRGTSDLKADLETGEVEVTVETFSPLEVLNGLHRGEHAGPAWRFLIDAAAALITGLAILGYILFFSLRFRIKTALILTAAALAVTVAVFVAFTQ